MIERSSALTSLPDLRIRIANARDVRADGDYVLYWMIAARRAAYNYALDRAVELSVELSRPLVVLEPLRAGYRWASDRVHRFIIEGMADNAAAFAKAPLIYYPYVEPAAGAGEGLLRALGERACAVVTDEFPAFFLPRMVAAAARELPVRLEQVDSNGILPLRASTRVFTTARSFRIFLHRNIKEHLGQPPQASPFREAAPEAALPAPGAALLKAIRALQRRWPAASADLLGVKPAAIAALPIDHSVGPGWARGGSRAAAAALSTLIDEKLDRYIDDRDDPDAAAASGLSPYLHFGHISVHEVFARIARRERFSEERLSAKLAGKREGFWGMSPAAEAFLDQIITWREIGFNQCSLRPADYDRYASLPEWAKKTLAKHAADPRPVLYSLAELSAARTHDRLWNAAQSELVRDGRIHNYLRMLWGKKILEWTRSPEEALEVMVEMNNKYALDGRDPNSYAGIFWVLGRYDRAWGPERPIFGTIRYMSSISAARKLRLKGYLNEYAPAAVTPVAQRRSKR